MDGNDIYETIHHQTNPRDVIIWMSTLDEDPVLDDAYNNGYSMIHGDGALVIGPT